MKWLMGCECSGVVRNAFRALGHDAWSCDIQPAEDNSEFHYQCDIRNVLGMGWDGMICFPDCTYLCRSGLHWNKRRPERAKLTESALELVRLLMGAEIPKIALENSIGCIGTRIRPADQIVQPYNFGNDASKGTCLWLKGLPILEKTTYFPPRMVCACGQVYAYEEEFEFGCPDCGAGHALPRWGNQTNSGQNKLPPSKHRAADRARTYPGIAQAMALQWGGNG